MNVKNIDVTLRDGGYRNNFSFSIDYIIEHVKMMHKAKLNYIELGYKNGSLKYNPSYEITAQLNDQQIYQIAQATNKSSLCIMLHPKNITSEDIKNLADLGVSMSVLAGYKVSGVPSLSNLLGSGAMRVV